MRVSKDSFDRDYTDKAYTVTLDGARVSMAFAADDERGYVIVPRMRNGRYVADERDCLWGKVVITEIKQ